MALKVLMLRKKLTDTQKSMEEIRKLADGFAKRETELEKSIEEAATEDERAAVQEAVDAFEKERSDNAEEVSKLQGEIDGIEKQIKDLEEAAPVPEEQQPEKRKDEKRMSAINTRTNFFGMSHQERDSFLANEDVKTFLERVRTIGKEKRTVNGAEVTIPVVVTDILREQIDKYSKLLKHVRPRRVKGRARQIIAGTVPEAIWTEMIGKLNELTIAFNDIEVDGYMVGGFIPVHNAVLEDSDLNLAQEIISALGQAIGYALDKAVIYGLGGKMPLGIVTRLAQTVRPSDYPTSARPWEDLHTSNINKIGTTSSPLTGLKLFQEIIKGTAAAKGKYSTGTKFWAMRETTYTTLLSEALAVNAAGAIVSGVNNMLPIIGGEYVLLDFIPDGDIIGGYGDLYSIVERSGAKIELSEHARFVEYQTLFRGVARYDGKPAIAEGFVAMNIIGKNVTTAVTFAPDDANQDTTEG